MKAPRGIPGPKLNQLMIPNVPIRLLIHKYMTLIKLPDGISRVLQKRTSS